MSECHSLLPGHSTPLEKDLEKLQCRVYDQKMVHRDLWNPETCPSELLPWLAWAESVDVWNDRWPDSTKRAVIANSRTLHEIKGTQQAVEDSLAALGVRVEIVEWWQETPPAKRGTQKLTLWVNNNINPDADIMNDSEMIRDLVSSVNRAKRGCVHYTLTLGVEMDTGYRIAVSGESALLQRTEALANHIYVSSQQSDYCTAYSGESALLQRTEALANHIYVSSQQSDYCTAYSGESALLLCADAFLNEINITSQQSGYCAGFSGYTASLTHLEMIV